MSDRRTSHKKRRPDPYASFSYEMERAESTRRAAITAGAALTVFVAVVIAVVAAAVAGARPAAEKAPAVAVSVPSNTSPSSAIATTVAEATATGAPAAELLAQGETGSAAAQQVAKTTPPAPTTKKPAAKAPTGPQRFSIAIGDAGYQPAAISAKAGVPIVLSVAQGEGCAAGFLMPELDVALDNSTGPVTADLGALEPGEYRFTCGMDMVSGLLMVR